MIETIRRSRWLVLFALATASCAPGTSPQAATENLAAGQARAAPQFPRVARSPSGMVVTGSSFATDVGARVLAQGGNAVDAAVAAAFVLSVVEPSMSGIGGRSQLLVRTAVGEFVGLDGTTLVPAAWRGGPGSRGEQTYGYESIAVPGTVAALAEAIRRLGRWPLARVMAPAIELAEEGFFLPEPEAARIAGVATQLREFEGSRHYFLKPDGSPFQAGDRLRQPDLARTLRSIAAGGPAAFYRGDLARAIEADVAERGGYVRYGDLAGYSAEDALVVRGSYRGHDLVGTYLPASGATTIQILQVLEHFDLAAYAGSARWASVVAQALLLGFADRDSIIEPPSRKAAWLVSRALAAERAGEVHDVPAGRSPNSRYRSLSLESEHTTHISVADRDGMIVALTQSVGPLMGSKVAAPGLGFVYAATMGYLGAVQPGERPWSSQSPLIVMRGDQATYVLGAAGARRIISALVETLSRAIDQRLPLEQAMAAPRFHVAPGLVELEARPRASWSPTDASTIRRFGFDTRFRSDAPYFARINAIAWDEAARRWVGVADSRWEGAAAAPSAIRP